MVYSNEQTMGWMVTPLGLGLVAEDEYRVSPLPAGANDGDDVVPQYLDINGRNSVGATPLELAASQGHLEVVK